MHQVAAGGFATGTNDLVCFPPPLIRCQARHWLTLVKLQYDRARPTYPAGALQKIHDSLGQQGPLTILEPGSGTGIFTRLVLSPPQDAGYPSFAIKTLVGVEPSAGMRESWQKGIDRLPAQATSSGRVESVNGTFDDFSEAGVDKGQVDGIIIAQAFHWCPDYDSALVSCLVPTIHLGPPTLTHVIARDRGIPQARPAARPDLEPGEPRLAAVLPCSGAVRAARSRHASVCQDVVEEDVRYGSIQGAV